MPQPVMAMMIAGKMVRLPFLLSHTPTAPPAHHRTPMSVCCRSLCVQGPPWCSVKVFTMPQSRITQLSINSWERPVRLSHETAALSMMSRITE